MSRTSPSAARIGSLLAESREHAEAIARLRLQPVSNGAQRLAREIEIARIELRVQRNQLEILACQITLHEARLSRYDAVAPDDRDATQIARILQQGLATLQTNRDAAERRLRKSESDLDGLIVRYQATRTDQAASADHQ